MAGSGGSFRKTEVEMGLRIYIKHYIDLSLPWMNKEDYERHYANDLTSLVGSGSI